MSELASTSPVLMIGIATLFALLVALLVTRWLAHGALRDHLLDHPNDRSLHQQATPRGGGIGILAGLAAGLLVLLVSGWQAPAGSLALLAGVLLLAAVSLADDARPLPALVRIGVHFVAAGGLVFAGVTPDTLSLPGTLLNLPPVVAAVLAVLFTVWMSNLYNFMDGMDGFAGGMSVLGFATLALLTGGSPTAALCLLVAVASMGFLVFNFPPARIFMGDVGSVPLGFLAAALILLAERDGLFGWWLGVLVFSPFVVDASITLARRLSRGERVWQAHRSHYYQRLVRLGWGHRRTVLCEYALMIACSLSALVAAYGDSQTGLLVGGFWLVGYTALVAILGRRLTGNGETRS